MTYSWKRAAVAGVLCLGLAAVASAGAAQDRPSPPPGAGERGPGMPHMDRGKMFEAMRARRQKMLHDILAIKPDQEAAFHAFLTAAAPPASGGDKDERRERGPDAAPMTTPQRLDRMASRMAERQAQFQQMASATKTFYAILTPDQRRAFDALPMMMAGPGGQDGHMAHGPMMGGRPPEGAR